MNSEFRMPNSESNPNLTLLAWVLCALKIRPAGALINTPLQQGVCGRTGTANRFNGFQPARETVETVDAIAASLGTPLKQGFNERKLSYPVHQCAACGLALLLTLAFAGCSVGPDYKRPSALGSNALPTAFVGTPSTNVGEWKPANPSAHLPRGAWWEMFDDAELNRLETLANTNNQDLALAVAHFAQARALVNVAQADYFPQISTAPSYNRQRTSANMLQGSSTTFNTFSIPLDASWELDLFGRVRHTVQGSQARLAAAADDLEATRLTLQAEIAIDYFALRSLDSQHAVLSETIKTYERSLQLTQNRHKSGIATEQDVALADTQLQSTVAQLPAVELQRANLTHALAVLCGQPAPGFSVTLAAGAWPDPPSLPVALPSEILEHRPDIAAAERRMAAANADVGVAQSAFYPRVFLTGSAGLQSIDAGTLFNWPSRVWAVGPSLQLPLFTGGRTRAQLAAARSAYDQNVASYRQTVLTAFQEIEDHLAAQRLLGRQLAAETAALKSARRTLEIANLRYKGGVITYLEVAVIQGQALSHEQTVVSLRAQRLASSVSLIKALGAGWTSTAGTAPPKP